MLVSRSARSRSGSKSGFVLVELPAGTKVDKPVVPAVLEFVIRDICETRSRHGSAQPNVALVCVDRPPREYEKLLRRNSIASSSVIDGFSQWYPQGTSTGLNNGTDSKGKILHIGDHIPFSNAEGSLCSQVRAVLNSSINRNVNEELVLIDSLTSVLRLYPGLQTALNIKDALLKDVSLKSTECSLTLVCFLTGVGMDTSVIQSLKRVADTHVILDQAPLVPNDPASNRDGRSHALGDQVRMKVCKKRPSGRVQVDMLEGKLDWRERKLSNIEVETGPSSNGNGKGAERQEPDREQEDLLGELGLSFRLSLSTKEKEVRAAAGLPYLHQDESLANSALQLHPPALQLGQELLDEDGDSEDEFSDSEGELFSEDV